MDETSQVSSENRGFCGNLDYSGGDERVLPMLYQEFYHAICFYKDPVLNQPSIMTCQQGFFLWLATSRCQGISLLMVQKSPLKSLGN